MRMQVIYEWDYEKSEGEDIVDHWHEDKLVSFGRPLEEDERLVLVRNAGNDAAGLTDRLWAYVKDGRLPEYFSNANGSQTGYRVPVQYHNELAYYLK